MISFVTVEDMEDLVKEVNQLRADYDQLVLELKDMLVEKEKPAARQLREEEPEQEEEPEEEEPEQEKTLLRKKLKRK